MSSGSPLFSRARLDEVGGRLLDGFPFACLYRHNPNLLFSSARTIAMQLFSLQADGFLNLPYLLAKSDLNILAVSANSEGPRKNLGLFYWLFLIPSG
jgi:hypothetical protein